MLESLESRRMLTTTLEDGVLTIRGSDVDDNVMVWQPEPATIRVEDGGDVTDYATNSVSSIYVNLYGGDDQVTLGRRTLNAVIIGGEGNDSLSAGEGNDTVCGDGGDDYIFGGGGHDYLNGGDGTGDDADEIIGGTGWDTVDYSSRTDAVRVGIGENFNDGEASEGDNVRESVDIVIGGAGNDELMNFTAYPTKLYGNGGDDLLTGGERGDTLSGGAGEDLLQGAGGFDSHLANDGEVDVIIGGANADGKVLSDPLDEIRAA